MKIEKSSKEIELQQQIDMLQEQLEAQYAYYESILSALPGHVYWLDKNNVYIGCNDEKARSAGLKSRRDIVHKTNSELSCMYEAREWDRNNIQVMQTGRAIATTEYVLRLDREIRAFHSQKVPLKNKDNEVVGVLGLSVDITDFEKLQKELLIAKENAEVASQAKSDFIDNMSHDIRTPLTAIIIMSDLLEQKAQNPDDRECANLINTSSQQLLALLNNILDMTKDGQDKQVKPGSFSIKQLLHDICELEQPSAQVKNLKLIIEIDPALPDFIVSDSVKIHRTILNIVGNALKFTEQGSITISANAVNFSDNNCTLELIISDTGIGILPELKDKIFDRFFKVSPSAEGLFQGYGVGLNIVQQYIQQLNGHVSLDSEPGVGTTFKINIPVKIGVSS